MLIPIRCFTCLKLIADKHEEYLELLKNDVRAEDALNKVGMNKMCCRRMFLGYVDIITGKLLK